MSKLFWEIIESNMACNVPPYITTMLELNGFDSAVTIEELQDSDIEYFEKFVKENMSEIITKVNESDPNKEIYLTKFEKNPDKFKFLRGHSILLKKIVQFTKEKIKNIGYEFFVQPQPKIIPLKLVSKPKKNNQTEVQTSLGGSEGDSKKITESAEVTEKHNEENVEINKEQSVLYSRIKNLFKEKPFSSLNEVSP